MWKFLNYHYSFRNQARLYFCNGVGKQWHDIARHFTSGCSLTFLSKKNLFYTKNDNKNTSYIMSWEYKKSHKTLPPPQPAPPHSGHWLIYWGDFINMFTHSFYVCRSKKRWKIVKSAVFFTLFGFASIKVWVKRWWNWHLLSKSVTIHIDIRENYIKNSHYLSKQYWNPTDQWSKHFRLAPSTRCQVYWQMEWSPGSWFPHSGGLDQWRVWNLLELTRVHSLN